MQYFAISLRKTMMYAVIKMGGNQYKVSVGEILEVDRVQAEENTSIKIPAIMVVDGENVKLAKEAEKVMVTALVLKQTKGEKIDVMRFRHKVRHRRHIGFRAYLSEIKITAIGDVKETKTVVKAAKVVAKEVKAVKTTKTVKKAAKSSKIK